LGYNIIIADPRDILRIGWRTIFTSYECITNIYEAVSKEHLDQLLQTHSIDLIFVHQSLVTNITALPPKRFVLLTTKFDIYTFQAAHEHGARGYLLDNASAESLLAALTLPEDVFLTEPRIVSEVISYLSHDSRYDVQDGLLTPREKEILYLLRSGIKREDISRKLNISKSTLKTHIGNIDKKRNILQI
jgi:DNA-binding NarL/FixJ family response regulator